jgi:hypothetical protein
MPSSVERRTVDLSAYPDLVVIYLAMRVNRLMGLKTLFGFGPKIADSVAGSPTVCFCMRTFCSRFSRCTQECGSIGATWNRFWRGPGRIPTVSGGRIFSATPELASGTRLNARWNGSDLRRHRQTRRLYALCACRPGSRSDVRSRSSSCKRYQS